jgi:hypothetical protein
MDLCQRPGEDQRHRGRKTNDRQLQRRKDVDDFVEHILIPVSKYQW